MKVTELRIGNLVYPDASYPEPITVCAKDFEDTTYLKPIPLTEEWLLKFGFKKINSTWLRLGNFAINISLDVEWGNNWMGVRLKPHAKV